MQNSNAPIGQILRSREIGLSPRLKNTSNLYLKYQGIEVEKLTSPIFKRLDNECDGALKHIVNLRAAYNSNSWEDVENIVADIIMTLLDK